MDEKVVITFPNEGEYDIEKSIIKEWKVTAISTVGDTVFCENEGSSFSMKINDYNRIF